MDKTIGAQQEVDRTAMSEMDQRLLQLVEGFKKRIRIVGVGGSGCNTITRLSAFDLEDTELIAMNTDAQALLHTIADKKILLGAGKERGVGAGSDAAVGERAAKESIEEVKEALKGAKLTFLTTGLGGGTGSGASPIVAQASKQGGAVCVAIITLPFKSEGAYTQKNAETAIKKISDHADTTIVIPNEKLLEMVPNLPLNSAFGTIDRYLADTLKGIIDLAMKPGLVNRDLADLSSTFRNAGLAVMGVGESTLPEERDRIIEAIRLAMECPLLGSSDISTADRVLINIAGSQNMKLDDAKEGLAYVMERVAPGAGLFWGIQIDERLNSSKVRATVITCGVKRVGDIVVNTPHESYDARASSRSLSFKKQKVPRDEILEIDEI